jgi:hypothetical protein
MPRAEFIDRKEDCNARTRTTSMSSRAMFTERLCLSLPPRECRLLGSYATPPRQVHGRPVAAAGATERGAVMRRRRTNMQKGQTRDG